MTSNPSCLLEQYPQFYDVVEWHKFLDANCLEVNDKFVCKQCNKSYDNHTERYECIKNHWRNKICQN